MKPKRVVVIMDSNGFPHGMAATQRIRLLSRGLVKNGFNVTILCIRAVERPPVENVDVKGCYQGIDFEYTPGTTERSKHFWGRRWSEAKGFLVSLFRILSFKSAGTLDCIYLWGTAGAITLTGSIFRALAGLFRIPLLIELNERPWSLKDTPSFLEKRVSPLIGVTGVIVISSFLQNWVESEASRISKKIAILYIPILVDPQEVYQSSTQIPNGTPTLLFAGAPQYDETIRFLCESMKEVVKKVPGCQLIITGAKGADPAGYWLKSDKSISDIQNNINLIGYVSRSELLSLYSRSNALLIPLFNDIRSIARFPTKLGEYLMSGRPVITNNIGELNRYLENNQHVFFSEAGDPKAYAEAILKVLDDPIRADEIGQKGKELASQRFDYLLWGKRFSEFIATLC